jgi:hypothetical protein
MSRASIIFTSILGVLLAFSIPLISMDLGGGDLIAYWSSAHLLVAGGDPYDQAQMSELQSETQPDRFNNENPILNAWNPPWLLLAFIPIGILPYGIAVRLWIFITTFLIAISIGYTWKLINLNHNERDHLITILVGFTFGPTLSLLALGQISGILLVTFVLAIYFLKTNRDFLAGAVTVFALIKPHISYFFIVYILVLVIIERRWKFFWGFASTILFSFVAMWVLQPNWIDSYIKLISSLPYSLVYTSTLGSFIASVSGNRLFQSIGIFLLPVMWYISYRLSKNDLLTAVYIGLLVSIPLSAFGFLFDQVVLIPALVQTYAWGIKDRALNISKVAIIIGYLTINLIVLILLAGGNIPYYWFFWIPFGILILFMLAMKGNYAKLQGS